MADSSTYMVSDERSEQDVRKENRGLVKDIVRYCSQRDYKKHNVLLVGQSGSGKSSIINTLLKVIIGEYIPRAKAGSGDVASYTLHLKCYKSCGTKDTDFEREDQQKRTQENRRAHGRLNELTHNELMWTVREQLPDIFDAAGMKDKNDEATKEILRLLVGGHISRTTNMEELMRLQQQNGLGYLPMKYRRSRNDYKISMVVFACSCIGQIPFDLIKCVREVLQEVDPSTKSNKYDTDIFVLITKYDKVKTVGPKMYHTDVTCDSFDDDSIETISTISTTNSPTDPEESNKENTTEPTITIDEFKEMRRKVTETFIQTMYSHTTESPKYPKENNKVNKTESTITLDKFKEVHRKDIEAFTQTIISHTTESTKGPEEDNKANETELMITLDKFKEVHKMITEAFIQKGTATHSQLNWANLNDSIGYDNVYIDNTALKLLKVLTTPLHTDEMPQRNNLADQLNNILVNLLFIIRRALNQNIELHVSHILIFIAAVALCIGLLWIVSFGNVRRNGY